MLLAQIKANYSSGAESSSSEDDLDKDNAKKDKDEATKENGSPSPRDFQPACH